jgi:hypothetical protein
MAIDFSCVNPDCRHLFSVPDDAAGKTLRCPACGRAQTVPPASEDDLLAFTPPPEDKPARRVRSPRPSKPEPHAPGKPRDVSLQPVEDSAGPNTKQPAPAEEDDGQPIRFADEDDDGPAADVNDPDAEITAQGLRAAGFVSASVEQLVRLLIVGILVVAGFRGAQYGLAYTPLEDNLRALILAVLAGLGVLLLGGYLTWYVFSVLEAVPSRTGRLKPPELPGWSFAEQTVSLLWLAGVVLVYVLPVITLPLLPLGLLAAAKKRDARALDLRWAARAAGAAPAALARTWGSLVLWGGIFGGLAWVCVSIANGLMPTGGDGLSPAAIAGPVVPILAALPGVLAAALACAHCVGLVGHYRPKLLKAGEEEQGGSMLFASVAGAVLLAFLVQTATGWPLLERGGSIGSRLCSTPNIPRHGTEEPQEAEPEPTRLVRDVSPTPERVAPEPPTPVENPPETPDEPAPPEPPEATRPAATEPVTPEPAEVTEPTPVPTPTTQYTNRPPVVYHRPPPSPPPPQPQRQVVWHVHGWAEPVTPPNLSVVAASDELRSFSRNNVNSLAAVGFGPQAESFEDAAFVAHKQELDRLFTEDLARVEDIRGRRDCVQTFAGQEWHRFIAFKGYRMSTVLIGIQDGRCVHYWFGGPTNHFTEFLKGLGEARLEHE